MPRAIALEWLLTGRRIPADELLRWGVVNRVVPAGDLMSSALELADAIEQSAPLAVAAALEVIRETEGMATDEAFELLRNGDLPTYRAMQQSEDALEGPAGLRREASARVEGPLDPRTSELLSVRWKVSVWPSTAMA